MCRCNWLPSDRLPRCQNLLGPIALRHKISLVLPSIQLYVINHANSPQINLFYHIAGSYTITICTTLHHNLTRKMFFIIPFTYFL